MKRLLIILVALFSISYSSTSQTELDSSKLRISLLTCTPGAELYSVFGHNALRIVDSSAGTDIVYNFGTFDFNDPDFYTKFVRGKLLYFVSQVAYPDFLFEYQYFKRGVTEQVLQLPPDEKKKIQSDLFENVREENRYYKYDFLYDNCSTRLRDIIFKTSTSKAFDPPPIVESSTTFRDHLHSYLDRAEMEWTELGIDLLLGVGADFPMNVSESMFLPDYLFKGVALARTPLGKLEQEQIIAVSDAQPTPEKNPFYASPLFVIGLFSLLLLLPSLLPSKGKGLQVFCDRILLIVTGMFGIFLLFMWFGTDHQSFSKNINLVWAFPLNIYIAFRLDDVQNWIKKLLRIWSVLLVVLIAVSLVYAGIINTALYPLMFLLSYRYWLLSKNN
ncbi:MAG: DUF4105 domain-containing protein [Chitinophagia bacterium]|jgi:hypothetical protein|nr:DUF4105 domain-containing protein [Chitinophagia bacterium]